MEHKTDYEREIEHEIEHDSGKRKKRKTGGTARGHAARQRMDRPRRQMGGVNPAMPAAGGRPMMPPGGAAAMPPRPMSATMPQRMMAGRKDGGGTGGQKWVPGLGDEDTEAIDKSRGRPILEERLAAGGSSDHWIKGAIKHPGALHRDLHVPEGQKIPEAKIKKAEHSDNPTLRRRANLAETLKGMR